MPRTVRKVFNDLLSRSKSTGFENPASRTAAWALTTSEGSSQVNRSDSPMTVPIVSLREPHQAADASHGPSSVINNAEGPARFVPAFHEFRPPTRVNTLSPLFTKEVGILVITQYGKETNTEYLDLPRGSTEEVYSYIVKTKVSTEKLCKIQSRTAELSLSEGTCVINWEFNGERFEDSHRLECWEDWATIETLVAEYEIQGHPQLMITITRKLELIERLTKSIPVTMVREWLWKELRKAKGTRSYIPKHTLETCTTQQIITRVVDDEASELSIPIENSEGIKHFAGKIYRGAQILFALFVLEKVPFGLLEKILTHSTKEKPLLPLPSSHPEWLNETDLAEDFILHYQLLVERQWPLQAASFDFVGQEQSFDSNIIVPYLSKVEFDHGAFSTLFKVRIEHSHQNLYSLPEEENPELALKVIDRRKGMEKSFRNEQLILKGLQNLNHDHIIQLLGTYYQDDVYHLLFPLADCNLEGFMGIDPPKFSSSDSPMSKDFMAWMWLQMKGIASGICAIHVNAEEKSKGNSPKKNQGRADISKSGPIKPEFLDPNVALEKRPEGTGYHHDIKPENILHFSQNRISEIRTKVPIYGIFQIADFGIGKFHSLQSGTGTGTFRGTVTYAAPESKVPYRESTDINKSTSIGLKVSRPYDIWSFGCVIMEVLIWFVFGTKGRMEFQKARYGPEEDGDTSYMNDAFFSLTMQSRQPRLRQAVISWIRKLGDHPRISDSPESSLAMALSLIRKVLDVNPKTRPWATEVAGLVEKVANTARSEAGDGLSTIEKVSSHESGTPAPVLFEAPPLLRINTTGTVEAEIAEAASNSQRNSLEKRQAGAAASHSRQPGTIRRPPSKLSRPGSPTPWDRDISRTDTWKTSNTFSSTAVQPSETRGLEQPSPPTSAKPPRSGI